jgi:ATP-dependent DNA ligase
LIALTPLFEHIAEDGPIVFSHACRLRAEGIVSKKVFTGPSPTCSACAYQSGPYRAWIKARNPASIAVQRERKRDLG